MMARIRADRAARAPMGRAWRVLLLLAAVCAPLQAQELPSAALAYGTRVSGQIAADAPRALYTFEGLRGDLVQVSVRVDTGDLDPTLTVRDSAGNTVVFRDDTRIQADMGGVGLLETTDEAAPQILQPSLGLASDVRDERIAEVRVNALRLPTSGTYTITVARFGDAFGTTAGAFTLEVARIGASAEDGSTLRFGDTVINTISDSAALLYYSVRAVRGDILNVQMQRMSGSLDTALTITDANGFVLAQNDDSVSGLDAEVRGLSIPDDGQYIIIASRFGGVAGRSAGVFLLSVNAAPEGGRGSSTAAAIPIALGGSVQGTITAQRTRLYYEFTGAAGDTLTITMTRASGDLDTLLILTDATGRELASNDDSEGSQNSAIVDFTLPAAGRYLIVAGRYAGFTADGVPSETTGAFTLTAAPSS